jgi:hypothetical protein
MSRRFVASGGILRATAAAAVAGLVVAGGMVVPQSAVAGVARAANASVRHSPPECRSGQLRISIPVAIRQDPFEGMGNRAWNILLRNVSASSCWLRGWPQIAIRRTSGRPVATKVSDVKFSNLGPVKARRIIIRRGRSAVVTATGAAAAHGCVSAWTLRLTLPGASRAVLVRAPARLRPCVGGHLQLSPVYPESTLRRAVQALQVSAIQSPIRRSKGKYPRGCKPADVRARATSAVSGRAGTIVVLRLHTRNSGCALAESWPTVRLHESAGASPVAKAITDPPATRAASRVLTSYRQGGARRTVLPLRSAHGASIALVAGRQSSCRALTAVTIYPSAIAVGAGLKVTLARPLRICGQPRILPFLPDGRKALTVARGALAAARSGTSGARSGKWWRGTDSAFPNACGAQVPFREPRGDCSNGTAGKYGAYIGQVGSFQRWHGCGGGLNWLQGNYNAAQANAAAGDGLGAAAYWFAAGPGREPGYDRSAPKARAWGAAQARRVVSTDLGDVFSFPYVVMDVENNGAPPDNNGWNTVWDGACGGTVERSFVPPRLDRATVSGFLAYISANTSYFPAVYSAGGIGYGSWGGIFGSAKLSGTSEWTYVNETSRVGRFPRGWWVPGARPLFFGGASSDCKLLWQWSGGNGVLNRFGGDLDQIDGHHIGKCKAL